MNGTLTVEDGGSLYDFLDLFGRNLGPAGLRAFKSPLRHVRRLKRGFHGLNDRLRSERNVAHHYDLSDEMYGLFLDSERQYACRLSTPPAPRTWRPRSGSRSGMSRPSCGWNQACACWTWAAAGAASPSTSPGTTTWT